MGLGTTEILLICLLALILFGGSKLADIGKGMGEGIKNFKKGLREADDEEKEAEQEKKPADKKPTSEGKA
ncbi:MAG: twin-arginine translocase TatA/TatE family subunit [Deltaproteobacteria bacterium]|nr:twin-arginine translocase TatA/TatE family subunit [Deltaproteobacteria bacterium]